MPWAGPVKRFDELAGPDGQPRPKVAPRPPPVEDVRALAGEVAALVRHLGERVPPDVAGEVNMLVELAARDARTRGDRLRQALALLWRVPR
jgi:hypothetical protein